MESVTKESMYCNRNLKISKALLKS